MRISKSSEGYRNIGLLLTLNQFYEVAICHMIQGTCHDQIFHCKGEFIFSEGIPPQYYTSFQIFYNLLQHVQVALLFTNILSCLPCLFTGVFSYFCGAKRDQCKKFVWQSDFFIRIDETHLWQYGTYPLRVSGSCHSKG